MSVTIYRARWIAPITSPLIENGRLVVSNGRIISVEKTTSALSSSSVPRGLCGERPATQLRRVPRPAATELRNSPAGSGTSPSAHEVDLGDVVLMPALVNAHTHLELTRLHGQVPFRGSFVQWIRDLVHLAAAPSPEATKVAIQEGIRQSLAGGVVAVADIGHGQSTVEAWTVAPLHIVGLQEILGIGPRRRQALEHLLPEAEAYCETINRQNTGRMPVARLLRLGLSPHAPYSTDPDVYRAAIDFCRRTGHPICTHLAETREEAQFLADGTGPFRELLESWGLWDGSFQPPGCSPVAYAAGVGLLECRPLLAHVNYPTDQDLDLLASAGASVAYCPRTHAFFHHAPHRHRDMLARGINVCIGTDSAASVPSLSILDELRFLRARDKDISDHQLLLMGTLAGARALGLADQLGSLEPGKRAELLALRLTTPSTSAPLEDALCTARTENQGRTTADNQPLTLYPPAM